MDQQGTGKAKAAMRSKGPGSKAGSRRAYLPADERRQQILRAAQEAFSRSSLHGVSTREIAKVADINPASLFEHFGSKEALFREAVIAPLLKELRDVKSRVPVYEAASREGALELAQAGVQKQMGAMKRLFPLFTTALFSDLETGKALYREHFIPLIEERAQTTRALANEATDPYFLQLATLGILFIVAMDESFGDGRLTRAAAAEQFVQLIGQGTAPRPHESASTRHPVPGAQLHDRRRLGPSDLWVSPLALEVADFAVLARSASAEKLQDVMDHYLSRGGNFIETTNYFAHDALEAVVAGLIGERRDEVVLAANHRLMGSKLQARKGGTYRFRLIRSVEESLGRLGAECFDLLYVSGFEQGVHAAELVDACDDLIKQGKIRYAGFSGIPAWQVSHIETLAQARGKSPFVAIRTLYGAADRSAERDLLPMAFEMGLGVTTCPPLEFGEASPAHSSGRPDLYATFASIAEELGKTPSQVALAWKFLHPGIVSALVHPHSAEQLEASIAALQIEFAAKQIDRLESIVRLDPA